MYDIIKNGHTVALTERPNYIRLHPDGFYLLCPEAEAQGVAISGTPYNLAGRDPMPGLDEVLIVEEDAGQLMSSMASYGEMAAAIREGVNLV